LSAKTFQLHVSQMLFKDWS